MYKVAFDESVRALQDQADELSGIRSRLVSYLAFVGAATAFLVGSSLKPTVVTTSGQPVVLPRDAWFYGLASAGTFLMAVAILCSVWLLWPGMSKLGIVASANVIIRRHIERDLPSGNEAQLYRTLAEYNDKACDENESALQLTRKLYFWAIIAGAAGLCVWVALAWHVA